MMEFLLLATLGTLPTVLEALLRLIWAADRTDPAILAVAGTAAIAAPFVFIRRAYTHEEDSPIGLGALAALVCLAFAAYALWLGPDSLGAWITARSPTPSWWRTLLHLVSGALMLGSAWWLGRFVWGFARRTEGVEGEGGPPPVAPASPDAERSETDPLRDRLRDATPNYRAQAATEAARSGRTDLAPALAAMLADDPEPWPRAEAAAALGRLGDPGQVTALLRAFERDPDALVRGQAAVALARIGGTELLPRFLDGIARGPSRVSDSCTAAVGHLLSRHPETLPLIEKALGSRRSRSAALRALEKCGGESSLRAILRRFAGKSRPRDEEFAAADAIGERVSLDARTWIDLLSDRTRHILWRRLAAHRLSNRDPSEEPGLADAVLAAAADPGRDLRDDLQSTAVRMFLSASPEARRRLVDALVALGTEDSRVLLALLAAEHPGVPEGGAAGRALAGDGDADRTVGEVLLAAPESSGTGGALGLVRTLDLQLSLRMLRIPHLAAVGLRRVRASGDPAATPALVALLDEVISRARPPW